MDGKQRELLSQISSDRILFSCEGVAESVIVELLVKNDLLVFNKDRIITDLDNDDACYTLARKASKIPQSMLTRQEKEEGAEEDITVLCVQDQPHHLPLQFRSPFNEWVQSLNITTNPEIEMLVVYAENRLQEYESWKRRRRGNAGAKLKPSLYCKEVLALEDARFKHIKNRNILEEYWGNSDRLLYAIDQFRQHCPTKGRADFMLADLVDPKAPIQAEPGWLEGGR
ncbi:hypothetical protein KIM372_00770 [Bombiscardovia nodaiensis]|uniref:Uncharacterized protein n=1 Tax=Bombiscardovia nodaiensis TaxID=2932181 RepID=A0ABN6S7H3_9BIFI|nr:hypothetical protein KIM372_00770 [Bombiscardovia nodaiensis]